MAKKQWISVLGLWTMVFLFLGFPSTWDKWLAVITGILIIAIAYKMNPEKKAPATAADAHSETSAPFVENGDVHGNTPSI